MIITGHLKDENAYEKYMGHEYQKIIVEELTHIPREEDYIKLIGSCRSKYPELPAQILTTFNPGGAGHTWVKKRFVDKCTNKPYYYSMKLPTGQVITRSRIFIPATIYDNKILLDNDPGYLLYLNTIPDERLRKAWLEGDWEIYTGQYFHMFEQGIHVIEPFTIPKNWVISAGMDYGNVTCAEVITQDPVTKNFYVINEWTEEDKTRSHKAQSYLNFISDNGYKTLKDDTIADADLFAMHKEMDERKTPSDIFREEFGVRLNPIMKKSPDNRKFRIWCNDYIKDLLHWQRDKNGLFIRRPKLYFFKGKCKRLIDSLPSLQVNEHLPEDLVKYNDHWYDALKYCAITMRNPRNLVREKQILKNYFKRESQKLF
jgi:hypothetical protein